MAQTEGFHLTGDGAQQYESFIAALVTKPHAEAMFEHVALYEGERVLDVACGTGIVTRVAVERSGDIASMVGADLSSQMLKLARVNTPSTRVPVEWREADVCELPFPDASFDVVLCVQGLQYVPDKGGALRHIQRVLSPRGRLAFTVWSAPHPHTAALADAVGRHINAEAERSCLSPFAWGDPEVIRESVDDAGFRAVEMSVIESEVRTPSSDEWITGYIEYTASRSPFARQRRLANISRRRRIRNDFAGPPVAGAGSVKPIKHRGLFAW